MFNKKPKLQYESNLDYYPKTIVQAKSVVPEWYKKIPKIKNEDDFDMETGFKKTIKNCIPFLDSLTSGYMIVLPYDIYVKNNDGNPYISWHQQIKNPPTWRENLETLNLVPFEHYPREYLWKTNTAITLPVGYSALFTHPLNRHDLPFTTLSGIVDGGLVLSPKGNYPFYIKKNFEGVIHQGTPIIQILPFRQENWISEIKKELNKEAEKHYQSSFSVFKGFYKDKFWIKKQY